MGIQNPNSTDYVHMNEPNLLNMHKSLTYDGYGNPVVRTHPHTNEQPNLVSYADSAILTAYGRLRTSDTFLLGEYRYMYGSGTSVEMNDLTIGGSITVDYARVCAIATIDTSNGSRVVRQTKQYHPYVAGASNIGMISFTFNSPKPGLVQQVGMFDDSNGIFLRHDTVTSVVIRKNGIDTIISQSDWNTNRLDGVKQIGNLSGINLDITKSQLLIIDYQWLGVGRVRIGFVINGITHYVHQFNHANVVTEVYIPQPSLPCRWELYNTSTTNSPSQLMMICASVYAEGIDQLIGFDRSVSTDGTVVPISSNTGHCVLAIKLKNELVGKQNHAQATLNRWALYANNDVNYKVIIFNDSSKLVNPNWQAVPGLGWTDYTKNAALVANWANSNDYNVVVDDFVVGASGSASGSSRSNTINRTSTIFQNYDSTTSQIIAVVAYKLLTNADVKASLSWTEVK